jgi:hypothetical protein
MKSYLVIFSVLVFYILFFSCEPANFNFDVNCSECFTSKPDSADLLVHLTFNDLNSSIPLVFYKGKIESNTEEWRDTANVGKYPDGKYYLYSPVNEYYSIKATYNTKNGKTIVAVDGDNFVTRHVTDACDSDCWIVKGGILDVRLKYE